MLVYFRRDWIDLTRGVITGLRERRMNDPCRLAAKLVVGSIPAAVAGVLLEDLAETVFRSPWVIVTMLALVGVLFLLADRRAQPGPADQIPGWSATIFIGLAQAVALIPGTSRSGITMLAGISSGLSRASAARFSFLLAAPIIFGAGLFKLGDALREPGLPLIVGLFAAAVSGGAAIAFLLRYLAHGSFRPFAIYRIFLALAVAGILLTRELDRVRSRLQSRIDGRSGHRSGSAALGIAATGLAEKKLPRRLRSCTRARCRRDFTAGTVSPSSSAVCWLDSSSRSRRRKTSCRSSGRSPIASSRAAWSSVSMRSSTGERVQSAICIVVC